jgi:hypothetical protein
MPVIPTVYNTIRPGDYQTNTVKAYKRYTVTNSTFSASGYRAHDAIWKLHPPDVGDPSVTYPTNYDDTNHYVVWKSIDHRYYRNPYDPANCHEGTNRQKTEKNYFYSASVLSCPYLDVGESIKPGSVTITNSGKSITLQDDGNGNLRDTSISTASFASASRCFFYMSFNNEFRQCEGPTGYIPTGSIEYTLRGTTNKALANNINVNLGVITTSITTTSGLSVAVNSNGTGTGGIRIPHDSIFNNFNSCDRWTISLWVRDTGEQAVILAKGPVRTEPYLDPSTGKTSVRTVTYDWPMPLDDVGAYNKLRTPFVLYHNESSNIRFLCSNGTTYAGLSGTLNGANDWNHIVIRRDNTNLSMFINGSSVGTTTMPTDSTANSADITIGCLNGFTNAYDSEVDEIRFYDYAASDSEISSLAGRTFAAPTLYQTNVAGNVFYRNGQFVISSPMTKYNRLGGFLTSTANWSVSYRGVHRIYENEVLVRVPAGQFNYTLNPTATYRPGTAQATNDCNTTVNGAQSNNGPGDVYLDMFVSGTVGPYITTIGLYNDKAELIAIGKLANPVTKLDDVDMNFIIRWDY